MEEIRFEIKGIPPGVLMHNPSSMQRATGDLIKKEIPSPEVEAEASAYRLLNRQLYLKTIAFRSSMIDGGKGRKIGKFSATRLLGSSLFVIKAECPLVAPTTQAALFDYVVDVQRAVVQNQGVLRARALIPEWQTEVLFEYDPDWLTVKIIEEVFAIAGRMVGVGDYRPSCPRGKGGPYGRYTVNRIT